MNTESAIVLDVMGPLVPAEFILRLREHFSDKALEYCDELPDLRKKLLEVGQQLWEINLEEIVKAIRGEVDSGNYAPNLMSALSAVNNAGYFKGDLKTPIYSDVIPALEKWKKNRVGIYTYSTGSVDGQRMILKKTDHGDLRGYFNGFFDTGIMGSKSDPESYKSVCARAYDSRYEPPFEVTPDEETRRRSITEFISDSSSEVSAADKAGLKGYLIVREGKEPKFDGRRIRSLAEL